MTGIDEAFTIEDGVLIRRVAPRRGKPYQHACTEQVYKSVAHAIDELGGEPFTAEMVRERINSTQKSRPATAAKRGDRSGYAPHTQVMTAIAFLKERGCIVPARRRRHRAASTFVYEDALTEWHALREKGPADEAFGYE